MDKSRNTLEDLLMESTLPTLAIKNILNVLKNNYGTDWEIYGNNKPKANYENFSSLIMTLDLMNEQNRKIHKISKRKLEYLYKNDPDIDN